jgi:hypothetical protein
LARSRRRWPAPGIPGGTPPGRGRGAPVSLRLEGPGGKIRHCGRTRAGNGSEAPFGAVRECQGPGKACGPLAPDRRGRLKPPAKKATSRPAGPWLRTGGAADGSGPPGRLKAGTAPGPYGRAADAAGPPGHPKAGTALPRTGGRQMPQALQDISRPARHSPGQEGG